MSFNENDVNREQDGRFGEKVGSAPTFSLPDQRPREEEGEWQKSPWGGAMFVRPPVETPYSPPAVESVHVYEDDTEANRQFDVVRDAQRDDEYYSQKPKTDFVTKTQARLLLWRGNIDKRYSRDAITAASYGRQEGGTTVNPRAALLGAVITGELSRNRHTTLPFGGTDVQSAQETLGILDTKAGERHSFEEVHLVATAATDIDDVRAARSEEMQEELRDLYKAWFADESAPSGKAVARSVRENGVRGTTELLQR